jgi:hypothetical protein
MREDMLQAQKTFTSYITYDFIPELSDYITYINHFALPDLHCLLGYNKNNETAV